MSGTVRGTAAGGPSLERELARLGPSVAFPPQPDLATSVAAVLSAPGRSPATGRWRSRDLPHRGRPLLAAAAAVAVLLSATLAASPTARAVASDILHLRGVHFQRVRQLPPLGNDLRLGRRVGSAEAVRLAGFPVSRPALLGPPDETWIGGRPLAPLVSLVYRARPGLPPAPPTQVGALLTQLRSHLPGPDAIGKLAAEATVVEQVTVAGHPGYWLVGGHAVVYEDSRGRLRRDDIRLAANTVLWERDGVTFRLESSLGQADALRLADTVR